MTEQTEYIYNPPSRLRLQDGSVWGSEEITDLRVKFAEQVQQLAAVRQARTDFMNRLVALQTNVREDFADMVASDDLDIEVANEHLVSLGLEPLAVTWEFEATVRLRGYGKAPKEDDLEEALRNASFDVSHYGSAEVDDLEVQEVDLESFSSDRVVP